MSVISVVELIAIAIEVVVSLVRFRNVGDQTYLSITTVHGLRQVGRSWAIPRVRIFWFCAFLIGFITAVYGLASLVITFWTFPVNVAITVRFLPDLHIRVRWLTYRSIIQHLLCFGAIAAVSVVTYTRRGLPFGFFEIVQFCFIRQRTRINSSIRSNDTF